MVANDFTRERASRAACLVALGALLVIACSSGGGANESGSTATTSASGTSSTSSTSSSGSGATGSSTTAGSGGNAGAAGSGAGSTGSGGDGAGGTGAGGAGRDGGGSAGGPASDAGIDPSKITLSAISANQTVGLEWPRVSGATGYRLYWSNMAGVTPQNGMPIDVPGATYVHRALTNGTGYHYVVTAMTAAGEGPPSMEATGTPAGEWALEALGAGDFDDIATGSRVPRVPVAKRVHILLMPEGYLQAELATFHDHTKHNLASPSNDVDRWQKELFDLEPYSKFQDGFVVWYLPRASMTHTDGGMSAFGTDSNTAAAPLFAALDNAGPDAFLFPPVAASRNYVAAFLLFDPARGRAGVSGHTTSCTSPTDRNLHMGCSFGIGHAHEFTHAFANVRDEYLDSGNSSSSTSETQNVVATNKCDSLPWAHLLQGRGINTTAQLVGAFGRPMQGYHSELRCHMNGTHDNGTFYCAGESLNLRVDRFCNFCRELIAFHLLHRTEIIAVASEQTAFQTWKSTYRQPFFQRFGFSVPTPVPQTLTCTAGAKPVYEECMP